MVLLYCKTCSIEIMIIELASAVAPLTLLWQRLSAIKVQNRIES